MKRIVISGYYGFGNIGDEAVLAGIFETFRHIGLDSHITVISNDPARTTAQHPGVSAIARNNIAAQLKTLIRADMFISGGGSLFQDATSARSPYYYLFGLHLARLARCRTMVYAQGIGPLIRPGIRQAMRKAFGRVDVVSVRDECSAELLRRIGFTGMIHACADPSFMIEPDLEAAGRIIEDAGLGGKRLVGISLRPWSAFSDWIAQAADLIPHICEEVGAQAVFIPMQESQDDKIGSGPVLGHGGDPAIAKGLFAHCELVVGMRLHSLIFAVGSGVPCVPIVYDPKVSSFANEIGVDTPIAVGADLDSLASAFRDLWDHRELAARRLAEKSCELKEQALSCGRLVKQALGILEH